MSTKTNKTAGVTRAEFAAIKAQLKTKSVIEVAKEVGRNETTVRRIRKSASYAKYQSLIKGYQANRKAKKTEVKVETTTASVKPEMPARKPAAKPAPKATEAPKTAAAPAQTVKAQKPLLKTFQTPEKRSTKHAAEVLGLRTEIEGLKGQISQLALDKKHLKGQLAAQIEENIRLSLAFNRKARSVVSRLFSRKERV